MRPTDLSYMKSTITSMLYSVITDRTQALPMFFHTVYDVTYSCFALSWV